jgi:hypothetical protein
METMTQTEISSVAQLLNDDDRLAFMALGEVISTAQFEIGDRVNTIIARAEGTTIGKMQVYGYVAGLVGKSLRSVIYYADTAAFFPPMQRKAYQPLKFEHFKVAASYPEIAYRMLDSALEYMDSHNMHLPPVQWMVDYHQPTIFDRQAELNAQTPPNDTPADFVDEAFHLAEPIIEEGESHRGEMTPQVGRFVAERFWELVQVVTSAVAVMPLSSDRKDRIRSILRDLAEEMELAKHEIIR